MKPVSLICVCFLFSLSSIAQPTCFTNYAGESYCQFSNYPVIVIARVKELTPLERGYTLLRYKAATLEVFRTIKGREQPKLLKVDLPFNCAGEISLGGHYVFNLAGDANVRPMRWSRIDGEYQPWTNETLSGLESVIAGEHQPVLEGTVRRPEGTPFPGVNVIAKAGDATIKSVTDPSGHYSFKTLRDGPYSISVEYPQGFGPPDNYEGPRDTEVRDLSINYRKEWPCGERMDFGTALSARVTGTLDVQRSENGPSPYFSLIDVHTINQSFPTSIESYSYQAEGAGLIRFRFFHVPPGRYVLKVGFDRSRDRLWSFYYPDVRLAAQAKVIEVGLGTNTDLDTKLPPIEAINISGTMKTSDGQPLFGGVMLVDAEAPDVSESYSPADRDRDDIKFTFHAPKGRKYYLCAAYDGVKEGREIRLLKKLALDGTESLDDIDLVLDTPIKKGMYWWDQCRMMR